MIFEDHRSPFNGKNIHRLILACNGGAVVSGNGGTVVLDRCLGYGTVVWLRKYD